MNTWILTKDQYPIEGQKVIYFFELVGVHRGEFETFVEVDPETNESYTTDCFFGASGFLCHDVTHWMPDEGQPLPDKPEGY